MWRFASAGAGVVAVAAMLGGALALQHASASETGLGAGLGTGFGAAVRSAALETSGVVIGRASRGQTFDHGVNRDAKGDRLVSPQTMAAYRTVALPVSGLPATLVLVRLPRAVHNAATRRQPKVAPRPEGATSKPLVACEPIASILTEAGRSGMTGRCIT
jgi:hypothetical protein